MIFLIYSKHQIFNPQLNLSTGLYIRLASTVWLTPMRISINKMKIHWVISYKIKYVLLMAILKRNDKKIYIRIFMIRVIWKKNISYMITFSILNLVFSFTAHFAHSFGRIFTPESILKIGHIVNTYILFYGLRHYNISLLT